MICRCLGQEIKPFSVSFFNIPLHIWIISFRLYVVSPRYNTEGIPYLAELSILLRDCYSKNCTAGANWERETEARLLHFPEMVLSEARRRGTSPYLCSDYMRQKQITLISITRLQTLFIKKQHSLATGLLFIINQTSYSFTIYYRF